MSKKAARIGMDQTNIPTGGQWAPAIPVGFWDATEIFLATQQLGLMLRQLNMT